MGGIIFTFLLNPKLITYRKEWKGQILSLPGVPTRNQNREILTRVDKICNFGVESMSFSRGQLFSKRPGASSIYSSDFCSIISSIHFHSFSSTLYPLSGLFLKLALCTSASGKSSVVLLTGDDLIIVKQCSLGEIFLVKLPTGRERIEQLFPSSYIKRQSQKRGVCCFPMAKSYDKPTVILLFTLVNWPKTVKILLRTMLWITPKRSSIYSD